MCSLNSKCKKDSNNLSSLINLFFNGFTAAYLSFNLSICALLLLLFFGKYVILLFSSKTVNEILGLFISKSLGVMLLKLYLLSNTLSFDILSG